MKKVLCLVLTLLVAVGLIACSSPTPTAAPKTSAPAPATTTAAPKPTTTTTAAPTTSAAPTTTASPKPSTTTTASPTATSTAAHAIVNLVLRGGIVSGEGYKQGFGFADLFTKTNHPWIKATAMTSPGSADDAYALAKDPNARPNTIIWGPDSTSWGIANGAKPYFQESYGNLRFLFAGYISNLTLLTFDSKINELKDLDGKKVALYSATGATNLQFVSLFKGMDTVVPGFSTRVQPQYLSFDAGQAALRDGLLSAAVVSATIPPVGETKWVPASWAMENLAKGGAHFVEFPKAIVEAGAKTGGFPISYLETPKDGLIAGVGPTGTTAQVISWSCDAAMPEDLAYEITKFAFDHMKDMIPYSGAAKSWTPENRTTWPLGVANIHPGAVKFYKEKGLIK